MDRIPGGACGRLVEDRLDDFKYDLRRLREKTQWLEDLAKQADRQADSADLQSRLEQLIAGGGCT